MKLFPLILAMFSFFWAGTLSSRSNPKTIILCIVSGLVSLVVAVVW